MIISKELKQSLENTFKECTRVTTPSIPEVGDVVTLTEMTPHKFKEEGGWVSLTFRFVFENEDTLFVAYSDRMKDFKFEDMIKGQSYKITDLVISYPYLEKYHCTIHQIDEIALKLQ